MVKVHSGLLFQMHFFFFKKWSVGREGREVFIEMFGKKNSFPKQGFDIEKSKGVDFSLGFDVSFWHFVIALHMENLSAFF